jgi:lipid-binding SYLF domain-containing protein
MRALWLLAVSCVLTSTAVAAFAADEVDARLVRAREVYRELIRGRDREIPETLQNECKCVAVFPHVVKAAFGIGGRYGKGVVSCRGAEGRWSAPAPFTLAGGSWGFQIGAQAADVVLFFMTERGARSLLESKFTLGASASVAAGPKGRAAEAETDLKMNAEIYSYARAKGLFAGLSLDGARLALDGEATRRLYGETLDAKAILFDQKVAKLPKAAEEFVGVLPGGGGK